MSFSNLPAVASFDDLTPAQRDFVESYLSLDGRAGAEVDAALSVGLGNGERAKAARAARDMMRNPRVLSAIRSELSNRFTGSAALGLSTLIDLARSARSEQVRLSAAKELLDRGVGPVMSRSAVLSASMRVEDLIAQLDGETKPGRVIPVNFTRQSLDATNDTAP